MTTTTYSRTYELPEWIYRVAADNPDREFVTNTDRSCVGVNNQNEPATYIPLFAALIDGKWAAAPSGSLYGAISDWEPLPAR